MADETNPRNDSSLNETAKAAVAKLDLPSVDSPSISPASLVDVPAADIAPIAVAPVEPNMVPPAAQPAVTAAAWPALTVFTLKPRQRRQAFMAASVAIAGAVGAVGGVIASSGFGRSSPQATLAAVQEQKTKEQTLDRLAREVAALKIGLEAANKTAHAQIAKIVERTDRIERNTGAELVTGSISAPQTVPAAAVPVPTPRPAPRVAAAETTPFAHPQIVQDWAIREARDGYVYVQGHGDVYQVVPGAPLPGLGAVESIKQKDGRWVVTTPKGIIISMRDRRYFE